MVRRTAVVDDQTARRVGALRGALDRVQKQRELIVRQTLAEGVRCRFDPARTRTVPVWRHRRVLVGSRGRTRR